MAYKILCIDDDQVNIKILQKRIEEKGYEVLIAVDGERRSSIYGCSIGECLPTQ